MLHSQLKKTMKHTECVVLNNKRVGDGLFLYSLFFTLSYAFSPFVLGLGAVVGNVWD